MTVNRRYVWASGALAGVLLIFLWWRSGPDPAPEKEPHDAETVEERSTKSPITSLPRRPVHPEECAGCPENSLRGEKKRPARLGNSRECREFLIEAADAGNPNPDMSHLDCKGRTPLHVAKTTEQVQMLLDAGADVNAQDIQGKAPLHFQAAWAMASPSEESVAIVQMLLDAGADPWLKTNRGKVPAQLARDVSHAALIYARSEKFLEEEAKARGINLREVYERSPTLRRFMEQAQQAPLIAGKVEDLLVTAMSRSK